MKKTISAILILLTLLSAFTACGGASDGQTAAAPGSAAPDAGAADDSAAAETAAELSDAEKLAAITAALTDDYGGYTFTVLDRSEAAGLWYTQDVYTAALNGEPINDAVFERNRTLEESLNIVIAEVGAKDPAADIKASVLAGDDAYDLVTGGANSLAKLVPSGVFCDLYDVPELKLESDWWDRNLAGGFSIGGRLYFATGDISIMDNLGTWAITFNKDLVKDLGLDDPYAMVHDGTWVITKMTEMAKSAAADLDGDGAMGDADRYGSCTEAFNVYGYFVGCGQTLTSKDGGDLPVLSMFNERSAAIMDAIMAFQNDRGIITYTAGRADKRYMYEVFRDGLALFTYGGMMTYSHYRDSDVDYGILPAPKLEEAQDSYYNTFSNANFTYYCVPATASDLSRTGTVTEAMAAVSKYTLSPAYYDITLSNKYLRDEESVAMIDLILETRRYDLGMIFNWGECFNLVTGMFNESTNTFASKYAAAEAKINAAIDKFADELGL